MNNSNKDLIKKCLIVVDYQNDFVKTDGKLYDGGNSKKIENVLYEKIKGFIENNDDVIFTLDTHNKKNWENHPESKRYSFHCGEDNGSSLFGKINLFATSKKYCERISLIEKNSFAMDSKSLKKIVSEYSEITLCGIVSHICLFQNAVCLYNMAVELNKKINFYIFEKGCASFDKEAENFTFWYLKNILGFKETLIN